MHSVKLAEGIYWVGAVDWDLRSFHGHSLSTHRGSSYNSYLILDERPTLVDTVWRPFSDVLMRNVSEIIDPAKIEVVVANHIETDHSGSLPVVMDKTPQAEIYCSARGKDGLKKMFDADWDYRVVKTGDELSIGKRTLRFIEAPMLHWPDSMFTYLVEDEILMPNDAFGQHIATGFRFDDQGDMDEIMAEAQKYYANILLPFSSMVARKLEELGRLNLPIKMIAPSHGVIWRTHHDKIVDAYAKWSQPGGELGCVVAYDTMWGSTRRMAMEIGQGLLDEGVPVKVLRAATTDVNDLIAEVAKFKGLVVGSPTVNRAMLPDVAKFVHETVGLRPAGKVGGTFGSYGWSGEAAGEIEELLKTTKVDVVAEPLRLKWVPNSGEIAACREFGRKVAAAIKE